MGYVVEEEVYRRHGSFEEVAGGLIDGGVLRCSLCGNSIWKMRNIGSVHWWLSIWRGEVFLR